MIARTASGSVTSQAWYVASIPEECKSARVRAISDALGSPSPSPSRGDNAPAFGTPSLAKRGKGELILPPSRGVLPRKIRRGVKGARQRARWALIPVAPPDMTTTSPGLRFRLDESPKTDGA